MRIFWKQRTMKISANYIFVQYTLLSILSIVAMSIHHFSKRFIAANVGATSMVFKSNNRKGEIGVFQNNIVNETGGALFCIQIYQRQTLKSIFFGLIIMSKKLIASANSQNASSIFYIVSEIFSNISKTATYNTLFPILIHRPVAQYPI